VKELEEVKKAVESSEAERAATEARDLTEREKLEAERLIVAIAEAESQTFDKVSRLLHFLRLQDSLSSRHPSVSPLGLEDSEISVVLAAAERLLGEESEVRQLLIRGILSGDGEFQGISHSRFLDLAHAFANPPAEPDSAAPEDPSPEAPEVPEEQPDVPAAGLGGQSSTSAGFHFMQESELETPGLEDSQDWVNVPQNQGTEVEITTATAESTQGDEVAVEQNVVHPSEDVPLSASGNFDWAEDEEGGLPSIAGLQAKFGTPESPSPADGPQSIHDTNPADDAHANGNLPNDDDGFTQARGGRGRPRGDRGFSSRGGRGGERPYRGGDRGGFRGGFRGDRSRGGERGGYRGRGHGDWRGDERGRGGRGRGRARGFADHRDETPVQK